MDGCELIARCGLLQHRLIAKPATAALMKTRHCLADHARCARYVVAARLGAHAVPDDLYPSDTVRALALIAGTGDPQPATT